MDYRGHYLQLKTVRISVIVNAMHPKVKFLALLKRTSSAPQPPPIVSKVLTREDMERLGKDSESNLSANIDDRVVNPQTAKKYTLHVIALRFSGMKEDRPFARFLKLLRMATERAYSLKESPLVDVDATVRLWDKDGADTGFLEHRSMKTLYLEENTSSRGGCLNSMILLNFISLLASHDSELEIHFYVTSLDGSLTSFDVLRCIPSLRPYEKVTFHYALPRCILSIHLERRART